MGISIEFLIKIMKNKDIRGFFLILGPSRVTFEFKKNKIIPIYFHFDSPSPKVFSICY